MRDRRHICGAAAAILLALFAVPASAQTQPQGGAAPAPELAGIIHVCSSCHGPGGRSTSSTFPRLAGQQKDYLDAQLKAFRDKSRADPHAKTYMWGMSAKLTDPLIDGIAGYYASQAPVAGSADSGPEVAAGQRIYTEGVAAAGTPACVGCHGETAAGSGAVPRLAGQHSAYLERQLAAFASNARANEVMHETSKNLTEEQIRAVAAYLRTR